MIRNNSIFFLIFLLLSCNRDKKEILIPIPINLKNEQIKLCIQAKKNALISIAQGNIDLITDEVPLNNEMYYFFKSQLKKKYNLTQTFIRDSQQINCTMTIMDSIINVKFGESAKARIIQELNEEVKTKFKIKGKLELRNTNKEYKKYIPIE